MSAFANVNGGHIVIGLDEASGVAAELCGVKLPDIGAEVLRIEQILSTGIEPRIPGLQIRAVPLSAGSHAILIRAPKSWRGPHRVCFDKWHKFWVRNSAGSHEASMDELRHLFTSTGSAVERARAFQNERIEFLKGGEGARPLAGEGRFVLHIIPLSAVSSTFTIDAERIYQRLGSFAPLGSGGAIFPRFNLDGVINELGDNINRGYTQVFRNGIVEATRASLARGNNGPVGIGGLILEQFVFSSLAPYIDGLRVLDVEPPLILMFALEGVEGAFYHVYNNVSSDELVPFDRLVIKLPECVIEQYSTDVADYHRAVRPAFDALWNAVGFAKSTFFDENTGLWKGDRR